ncbi:hypothetical protein PACTADRAFT_73660 [Pachysolen tannophilus NRRL Y-2460]|uniref:Pre-mRNA-splicing factor CWC15 n=1 Tax=Pachysolen tannophilus NRRL Y-2460 TaxID=669874 RepID=A0A1E4U1Z4_PACTA|nr:hypothetical protein PACTADRAFT_73660 [Pachysolen tannophilus NRRL Y-2460]
MTTAHRPTFDHAKGVKNQNKTSIVHARSLPAHRQLKFRKRRLQAEEEEEDGDDEEFKTLNVDLNKAKKSAAEFKLELLAKEQKYYKENNKLYKDRYLRNDSDEHEETLMIEANGGSEETFEQRRQKLLEETRDVDASSSEEEDDDNDNEEEEPEEPEEEEEEEEEQEGSSESEDDSEDETEQLMKELAKIKKEREQEKLAAAKEAQEREMMGKNPLLNNNSNGRSWRNETVFQKQNKIGGNKEDGFVNDLLRNEFHKKFMDRFIK